MKTLIQNLFVALALLVGIREAAAQTSFLLSSNYLVGVNPYEVAAFKNVDGKVDLASANIQDGTLTILTNNGSGIFSSNATINVGNYPSSIVAADVNGDGYPDLVCANWNSTINSSVYTISIFTNNGSGEFGFNTNFSIGYYAYTLSIAAFTNVDGKVDLVAANYGEIFDGNTYDSALSVFTNNGSGVFGLQANYTVANGPYVADFVTVADVNGDGKPDLICADGNYLTLTVFTNDGTGAFALNATYNVGNRPDSVAVADVNGDGKVDLICANGSDNTLTVLTNNGFGIFGSNATYNVGTTPDSVTAADVNGDGKVDLICANANDKTLTVLTNNGNGSFVPACTNSVGGGPTYVTTADVNGDGEPDLISANQNGLSPGTVSVLFNTSTFSTLPFTYTTNSGSITITGYTGSGGAVTIPGTINGLPVTSIGNQAFFLLTKVTGINIPNTVTNMGSEAFNGCGLPSVNISSNVTSIGSAAFSTCLSLTNITVDAANLNYASISGVLFDKSQTTLIQYPTGLANGSYSIPNGVTSIGTFAFESCFALTSMTAPDTVASFGSYAFASCTGLTTITIPSNVTSIGSYAFASCNNLTNITFSGNAPTPGDDTSVFVSDSLAKAYYLLGTTGWGPTFDGIPTSVILPPAPALGISTYSNQPAVFFPTATGTNYFLQMTTNLSNGPWVTVSNGVRISGIIISNPPADAFFRLTH